MGLLGGDKILGNKRVATDVSDTDDEPNKELEKNIAEKQARFISFLYFNQYFLLYLIVLLSKL